MFSHPGLRHLQQVVKMAPLPSQRWWDSKSRELTLFDCLMLAVLPETGRSLDLQTSFWLTSSILETIKGPKIPKCPKKSTLAFSVPFITGLVLILDLTTCQLQPLMTSTPTSTTFLPLNLAHLHGVSHKIARAPRNDPSKGIFTLFGPTHLQIHTDLVLIYLGLCLEEQPFKVSLTIWVSLNIPCPQFHFCSTNSKYFQESV